MSQGRVLVFHIPSRPIGMPLHINGRYVMRAGESLTAMPPDMLQRIFNEAGPDFTAEICTNRTNIFPYNCPMPSPQGEGKSKSGLALKRGKEFFT
ncbi:hypothetical protein FACS1894110_07340 [Spirochaetia bacterium]|nr:hypothetical protein FACS1894110_07340 [Spirochaetia bacterium]